MKKLLLNACLCASLAVIAACNNSNNSDSKDVAKEQNDQKFDSTNIEDDTKFAVNAADGGMLEVQLGKLAQTNGSAQVVKDFGKQMVDDHSKANEELIATAKSKNITLPTTLSEDKQKMYDDLAKKKGHDFDKAYMDMMVDDHKKDVSKFEDATKNLKDADLKAFAVKTLPVLKTHLDAINKIHDSMK